MVKYPPLATFEERSLHGDWDEIFACMEPERPRDHNTLYDWRCHGCIRHAEASVITQGDHTMEWRYFDNSELESVQLSWLVERSKYLLNMP